MRGGAVGAPAVGALAAAALRRDARHRGHAAHGPAGRDDADDAAGHLAVGVHRRRRRHDRRPDDEDEGNKRPWLLPLLIAIAVLAVGGDRRAAIANANEDAPDDDRAVPTVVGLTEAEAKAKITERGPASTTAPRRRATPSRPGSSSGPTRRRAPRSSPSRP